MYLIGFFLGSRGVMYIKEFFFEFVLFIFRVVVVEGMWEGIGLWVGILGDVLKV